MPAIADLDHDRVEVDHRVEGVEFSVLPLDHLVGDFLGDLADRLVRQLGPERGDQMMLDIADGHPAGVKRDDHRVQAIQAPLALADQHRVNVPLRSRGTRNSTSPTSVATVLAL